MANPGELLINVVRLKERGLELSHEKTQIAHVEEVFDFLGKNVWRYCYSKVLTEPQGLRSVKAG